MTQLSTRHCANRSLYPKLKFVQEKVWACLMNLTWDLEPMSQKAIEEIISLSFTDLSWSWFILTIVSFILKKTRQAYTCWTAVYQFDIWEVVHSIIAKEWNLRSIRDAFVLFFSLHIPRFWLFSFVGYSFPFSTIWLFSEHLKHGSRERSPCLWILKMALLGQPRNLTVMCHCKTFIKSFFFLND